MKTELWAVICGNIRDELDFKLTLSRLIELREKNKVQHILLSTWRDEIDKYEGLRQHLKTLKVYVLENYPLSDGIERTPTESVNYWRQARQLLAALDVIPKKDFILRLRTDRSLNYINQMDRLGVFENYRIEAKSLGRFPKLFDYQITVFGPKMVRLLHMIDFVLLGNNRDLYKIINFDLSDLVFQKSCVANAQWFIFPFIKEFPILRDYIKFTNFLHRVKVLKNHIDEHKENFFLPEVYYKVYSIYLMILHTHFNIIHMGNVKLMDYSEIHFYQIFDSTPNYGMQYTILGTSIRDAKVLEYILFGKVRDSPQYKKFMSYVNHLIAHGYGDQHDLTHQDYAELIHLQATNFYQDQEDRKWFKVLRFPPIDTERLHKYPANSDISDLNLMGDDEQWKALTRTSNIENDIYRAWLKIENPNKKLTEKMLLPIARTGHQYAIFILLDLLRRGDISDTNKAEVERIAFFYVDLHLRRKNENYQITRIISMLLKMHIEKKIVIKKIDKYVNCAFQKYFDTNVLTHVIESNIEHLVDEIIQRLQQIKGQTTIEDFYIRDLIMLLGDEIEFHVDDFIYQSLSQDEKILIERKWLQEGIE